MGLKPGLHTGVKLHDLKTNRVWDEAAYMGMNPGLQAFPGIWPAHGWRAKRFGPAPLFPATRPPA